MSTTIAGLEPCRTMGLTGAKGISTIRLAMLTQYQSNMQQT